MTQKLRDWLERQSNPTAPRAPDPRERNEADAPPPDHLFEQYTAWRPTAIYNLGPFSAPPGR